MCNRTNIAHVFVYRKTANLHLPLISSRQDSVDLVCHTQNQVSEDNMKARCMTKWDLDCISKVALRWKDFLKNRCLEPLHPPPSIFLLWTFPLRLKSNRLARGFSFHFLCYFCAIFLVFSPAVFFSQSSRFFDWTLLSLFCVWNWSLGSSDSRIFISNLGYVFSPFDCLLLT